MSAPGPWKPLGCGSIRREGKDLWRVNYRPHGARGKRVNRLVKGSEADARRVVVEASTNRTRRASSLPALLSWPGALADFQLHLQAQDLTEKHVTDLTKVLEAFRDESGVAPDRVRPSDVQAFLDANALAARTEGRAGWARTSNKHRAYLNRFFRWMQRMEWLELNPVNGTFPKKQPKSLARNVTPEEYGKVWRVAPERFRDLLDFLLLTGCRFGEAAAMRRGDVREGLWRIPKRKSKDVLEVPLGPFLLELLLRQPHAPDGKVWHKWDPPGSGRTAPKRFQAGDAIDTSWMKKSLDARCKAAGVAAFGAHDLRHALGTWARGQGLPLTHIQDALGHSSIKTTEIYAHAGRLDGIKMVQETLQKLRDVATQTDTG